MNLLSRLSIIYTQRGSRKPCRVGKTFIIFVMKIVMNLQWDGVTPDQYEAVRNIAGWEVNIPIGGILHVASFSDAGLRVTDVWESADDFNRFVNDRLMPSVAQVGISTQPRVEITPIHAVFSPRPERLA